MLNRKPDADVAILIEITNMCQATSSLPRAGGLLDQDPYLIRGMGLVLNAQAKRDKQELEKASQEAKERASRR